MPATRTKAKPATPDREVRPMENQHVRALLRFWRIVAAGAVVAVFVAVEMVAKIGLLPPSLTPRAKPSYTATELLILNSASSPYLRTAVTTVVPRPGTGDNGKGEKPLVDDTQPNAQILVRAANLYPHLVESDAVAALRTRMFGPLHGTVRAEAYKSFQSATRYRPSSFPLIQILATTHKSKTAIHLARATTTAFTSWLTDHQAEAKVPQAQRILVQELQAARSTTKTGGTKWGLPLLVGAVVLALAIGIALGLDRLLPPKERAPAAPVEPEAVEEAKPAKAPARKRILSA